MIIGNAEFKRILKNFATVITPPDGKTYYYFPYYWSLDGDKVTIYDIERMHDDLKVFLLNQREGKIV